MQLKGDAGKFCESDVRSEPENPSKVDRIVINVGGYKHETHLSTLRNFPDSRLSWMAESPSTKGCNSSDDGNPAEYFFDRHPGVFVHVLNYYRTGKLHCPSDVCGPLFEEELVFWGIDELQMEPCCWSTYTRHREAKAFEKVFTVEPKHQEDDLSDDGLGSSRQRRSWYSSYKQKVWDLLEKPYSSKGAQILALVSLVVIIVSVVTFCLESMPVLESYKEVFHKLDTAYCTLFTVDFVARLFSCPDVNMFFRSTLTWCDIMSVIPFYTNMIWRVDYLNGLLVVRLFRIFRLFRFFRFMSGMQVIGHTLKASARELMLLVLILLIPMVIFSSLLFYTEKEFDGDPNFCSIPHSFWWAVITMTTVGYGDIYPRTALGKLIGTMCACSGVLIVALPVSVIGSNFSLFYSHAQAQLRLPHKRKQPVLVGAANALMSTFEPEAETPSMMNSDPGSDCDSKESLNGKQPLKKSIHAEEPELIELHTVTKKRKHIRGRYPYGSTRSLSTKQRDVSFGNASNGLGKGLKAMGDIVVNIAAPAQRRMAISGVSLHAHSPALRRNNSGKRRSKSGDSIPIITPTISTLENYCKSQESHMNSLEECVDSASEKGTTSVADDAIFLSKYHLPKSDSCLVVKPEGNGKRKCVHISGCEEIGCCDVSRTSSGSDTTRNEHSMRLHRTADSSGKQSYLYGLGLHRQNSKETRSDSDINMEGGKHKISDVRHKKSSRPEFSEASRRADYGYLSSWSKRTRTEPYDRVFPWFGRRRSTTLDICNM